MKLLVTGSNGFVGHRVVEMAQAKGIEVKRQQRSGTPAEDLLVCSISGVTQWRLDGVDCVIHCAARVHQMKESLDEAEKSYQQVNVDGTLNLARQAAEAGVKRFVFISSIKVNGEFTEPGHPFTPSIEQPPTDLYGQSKYQAEQGLRQIAAETGLEVVIVRPPLVYGPGVKANFATMMKWVKKGVPLPFGAINNQRSLVYLDNLVELLLVCCKHPKAAGEVFLVSDNQDVTTTHLLKSLAQAMDRPSRLLPIPDSWMAAVMRLVGKQAIAQRLFGSLQLDISDTINKLEWTPPVSFEQAIKNTVNDFIQREQA